MAEERVSILVILRDRFSAPAGKVRESINQMRDNIRGMGRQLRLVGRGFGLMLTPLRIIPGLIRTVLSPIRSLIRALFNLRTLIGALIAGLLIRQIAVAFDTFERKLGEIGTLLGATSFEALKPLGRALTDVAVRGAQTLEDELTAAYQAVSAGVQESELIPFLEKVNELAVAGAATAAQSTEALLTVLKGFARPFSDVGEAADSLFTAVRIGRTTLPELAGSLGRVVSIAKIFGLTMDETNAAMAALTLTMGNSELASTSLRALLTQLRDATNEQREASIKLGVDISQSALRTKGFRQFMLDLSTAVEKNNEAFSKLFPNVRAFTGAAILAADDGAELTRALDAMEVKAGETARGFQLMSERAGFAFGQLRTQFQGMLNEIGLALGPFFRRIFRRINNFITRRIRPIVRGIGDVVQEALGEESEARAKAREALSTIVGAFAAAGRDVAVAFADLFFTTLTALFVVVSPKLLVELGGELGRRLLEGFEAAITGQSPAEILLDEIKQARLGDGLSDEVKNAIAQVQADLIQQVRDEMGPELLQELELLFGEEGMQEIVLRRMRELRDQIGPLGVAELILQARDIERLEGRMERIREAMASALALVKDRAQAAGEDIQETMAGLLDGLEALFQGFVVVADKALQKTADTIQKIAALPEEVEAAASHMKLFFQAVQAGFVDFASDVVNVKDGIVTLKTAFESLLTIGEQIGQTLVLAIDDLAGGIVDAIASGKDLGDVFRQVFRQMLLDVAKLLIRMALLRILSTALGVPGVPIGGAGGGVVQAKRGQLIRRPLGGVVPGPRVNRDVVPALLTPGEYVVRREAVQRYGVAFMHALNRMVVPAQMSRRFQLVPTAPAPGARHLQAGGPVASDGQVGPTPAFIVPDDEAMESLLRGGRNAAIAFFRANRDEILGDLRL